MLSARSLWPLLLGSVGLPLFAQQPPPIAIPRFTHPGAGQTFYFVLTDRFANGRTDNDTGGFPGGPDDHGFDPTRISHYHGGDFAGVIAKLDYLQNLGVTAVWLTPPLQNKPMQSGTAGYHGYWITDFLRTDSHLGSNEEFRELIRQVNARGMKLFMDIITNHTADVIQYPNGRYTYLDRAAAPYRDANGRPFDERAVAFNGLSDPGAFPALSVERSFAYETFVPPEERNVKNPAWLNDVTLYHNRGNTTFAGENSTLGDFVGLDDTFTEHPRVVQGFIDVFSSWVEFGVDGFRIDTMRHVNNEFWQAFGPAIRARARELGRPDFLQFGEVFNEAGDSALLSEFSTHLPIDTTIDFGFFVAARRFVSQGGSAAALADFFVRDDYYTDHDSHVHSTTTFLGNHDAGRFAYFLQQDNPGASREQLEALVKLGHGLLFLSRGQPVLYYGDEQGMIGRGGVDMQARESMFASTAPDFATAPLLGTDRTGADDKFDLQHPFYRFFAHLAELRRTHATLRTGAMIPRLTSESAVAAFSRLDRVERLEYLVAFNNSRTRTLEVAVPTSQPAGAALRAVFDSRNPSHPNGTTLTTDASGRTTVSLAPLQFMVWCAGAALPSSTVAPQLTLVTPAEGAALTFTEREIDGLVFPTRRELRAEVQGATDFAEVTFLMRRASRPDQYEWLGTDDTAPYRVFWRPPSDLAPGETLEFFATVNDLRGNRAAARVGGITVAPGQVRFGIQGAVAPMLRRAPPANMAARTGDELRLEVEAMGTAPLEYQWLRNGEEVEGATQPTLIVAKMSSATGGDYSVLVRNRAGTIVSRPTRVQVGSR
jgi:alpha-amylase